MTEQEAVKKIQGRMDTCFLNDEPYPSELSIAISSLEKQVPMIPSNVVKRMNGRSGNCPVCRSKVLRMNYCQHCGQKLDWSDQNG